MKVRHVALLIETSREYGRGLLRGIIRYQQEHGPWSVYFKPHGLGDPPPAWLRTWRGDGILARINDRQMADAVLKTGVPAVDLREALGDLGLATVGIDNQVVVQLAFQHFLDRGFRQFAFCGTPRGEYRYQDERADRFLSIVADRGMVCETYFNPRGRGPFSWEEEQGQMGAWLKGLPKPIAVMTCHDDRGLQVLDACRRVALDVPGEVAILGVDNDPFLCNLSSPPLSSIDVNSERGGYVAAELLDDLMDGRQPASLSRDFAPRGVVTRQSTDIIAVRDPHVAHAVRLIRDNACSLTGIEELLSEVPISRSELFRRFKRYLNRSPKKEMSRVRLEHAKKLLGETDLPISAVAERVGFRESKYFIDVFHKVEGMTPLNYRRQAENGRFG
jgi:LacI family transcriptional regulator